MGKTVKIKLSKVLTKQVKIVIYLVVSGLGALALIELTNRPELGLVFAPAINFILVVLQQELADEGYRQALKK